MQKNVLEYLEKFAEKYAYKIAIADAEEELSFEEVRGYQAAAAFMKKRKSALLCVIPLRRNAGKRAS